MSPRSPRKPTKAEQIAEAALKRVPCVTSSQEPAKGSFQITQKSPPMDDLDAPEDEELTTTDIIEDSTKNDLFDVPEEATPMTNARAAAPKSKDCVVATHPPSEAPTLLSRDYHGLCFNSENLEERMQGLTVFDKVGVQANIAITGALRQAEDAIRALSVPEEHEDDTWELAAEWELGPLVENDNCRFLLIYGFKLADAHHWKEVPFASGPHLDLSVEEHVLRAGHNWYNVKCKMSGLPDGMCIEWMAPRRLAQLRLDLHDRVKDLFGVIAYEEKFQNSRFAKFGGPTGTTARLNAWLGVLASIINNGVAKPSVATVALVFLAAPLPEVIEPPTLETGFLRHVSDTNSFLDNPSHLGRECAVPCF